MEQQYKERVELHCHTKESEGYGICDPEDMLKFARQNQMPAVAFTDYGNVISYPLVQHYTKRQYKEVKPIYGIELLVADDLLPVEVFKGRILRGGYPANFVLILIQNEIGRSNLYHLLSEANLQSEDRVPWILWSRLQEMREGLLLGSGSSSGELGCAIIRGYEETILESIAERFDFLEVQPVGNENWRATPKYDDQRMNRDEIREMHRRIVSLGEALDIPVVATSDAHYLREENRLSWHVLMHGSGRITEMEDEVYFRTTEEMMREFSYLGEEKAYEIVIQNTNKISERIEKILPVKNDKKTVRYNNADEILRDLCEQGLLKRWGQKDKVPDDVTLRLQRELEDIRKYGFAVPFLHYHELIMRNELKPWQYMLKGNATASLVCYLLDISHTNPMDQNLPLYVEFLAGLEGNKEPVIELVVDENVVNEVIRTMKSLHGVEEVIRLAGIGCMSPAKIEELVREYEKCYGSLPVEMKNRVKCGLEGCLYRKETSDFGNYAIIPKGIDVQRYFPIEKGCVKNEKTSCFSRFYIDHQFLTYTVRGGEICTLLTKLQERVNYYPTDEDIAEMEFMSVTLEDYVKIYAITHGNVLGDYGRFLLKKIRDISDFFATAEDVYEKLMDYGMNSQIAIQIAELVRKGKFFLKQSNAVDVMRDNQVPECFVSNCENTRYLLSRAALIETAKSIFRMLYYEINYPQEYSEICAKFLNKNTMELSQLIRRFDVYED